MLDPMTVVTALATISRLRALNAELLVALHPRRITRDAHNADLDRKAYAQVCDAIAKARGDAE